VLSIDLRTPNGFYLLSGRSHKSINAELWLLSRMHVESMLYIISILGLQLCFLQGRHSLVEPAMSQADIDLGPRAGEHV
jgi:hypothetical protein